MDVMYNSFRIRKWKNFFVVELNGRKQANLHIFMIQALPGFAWKELARHITYMYEISVANRWPYLKHRAGMKEPTASR
jgi:hypothetical protein